MDFEKSPLKNWTPSQIALAKRWIQIWNDAGPELEKIRRDELRKLDTLRAVESLCGEADYAAPPRAPRPYSGLIEQQGWFKKLAYRD